MFRSIKRVSNDMQLATCYPTCTRYAKRNFPPLSEVPLVLTSYAIRLIRRLSHIALCQSSLVAVCRWSCSPWRRHSQYIANIQNVKHLGKEIFEKLGARRSRCAKSLVGEKAQKWALPRLWAWTRKCGRAHFLRPCPRDLGAQLQDGVPRFGQPWTATICSGPPRSFGRPRHIMAVHETLDVHTLVWSPIKFVDIHAIVWTPSARLPWASTKFYGRSHIRLDGHENLWTLRRLRGCPKCRHRWASTHIHGCPTTAIPWAPNYVSNFTHFGRPLRYGWSPTSFTLDSHKTIWATTKCYGRPTNAVLDAHEVLWTATRYYGCPRYACGHPAKRILGAHTLYCVRPR